MIIAGLQKLTIKDFPGLTACIVFTQGCNFKCPYCHNSELISPSQESNQAQVNENDFFNFLNNRKGLLDGVVISGGEPTIQKDLKDFIKKIRDLGFKTKLDTNGSNPLVLKDLIDENLLDYVAMDIKNDFDTFANTAKVPLSIVDNIKQSSSILENSKVEHEYRTTIVKEFHDIGKIENIIKQNNLTTNYYLQNFEDSEFVIDHSLHSFSQEELKEIENTICKNYENVKIR